MPTEIEDLLMAMEAVRLAIHINSTITFKSSNVFEHEPSVVRDVGGGWGFTSSPLITTVS